MDLLTSDENKSWTPLLAAVVAAFLVASAVGFAVDLSDDEDKPRSRPDRRQNPRVKHDEPDIRQAPWKLVAHAAGSPGKATKQQQAAVEAVAPKVENVVRDLYDSLTVSRNEFKEVSARLMPAKARNTLRGRPLVPVSLSRIRTTKREADIAIDLATRKAASAKVQLVLRAEEGKKRIWLAHQGTLWLERGEKGWQIIAFDVSQRARA